MCYVTVTMDGSPQQQVSTVERSRRQQVTMVERSRRQQVHMGSGSGSGGIITVL